MRLPSSLMSHTSRLTSLAAVNPRPIHRAGIPHRRTYLATRPAHVQDWMICTPGMQAAYTAVDSKYSVFWLRDITTALTVCSWRCLYPLIACAG
jgi:hypothetical protein